MLEKDIEDWLGKQIELLGGINMKFISPGKPGVPDRIYVLPDGSVYFVELKQQFGRIAGIQKWWREQLIERGCNYRLIKGMSDAKTFLAELKSEVTA